MLGPEWVRGKEGDEQGFSDMAPACTEPASWRGSRLRGSHGHRISGMGYESMIATYCYIAILYIATKTPQGLGGMRGNDSPMNE